MEERTNVNGTESEEMVFEPKKNTFFKIILLQVTAVLLSFLILFGVKTFFPEDYRALREWIDGNIYTQITVEDILDTVSGGENEI